MAEKQQEHDHGLEAAAQTHDHLMSARGQRFALVIALAGGNARLFDTLRNLRGQRFALVIALAGLGLGGYLLANDKSLLGAAAAFGPFGVLVGLFIWGERRKQRQRRTRGASPSLPPRMTDHEGES